MVVTCVEPWPASQGHLPSPSLPKLPSVITSTVISTCNSCIPYNTILPEGKIQSPGGNIQRMKSIESQWHLDRYPFRTISYVKYWKYPYHTGRGEVLDILAKDTGGLGPHNSRKHGGNAKIRSCWRYYVSLGVGRLVKAALPSVSSWGKAALPSVSRST